MAFDTKKFLDASGVTKLWQAIEAELATRDTAIASANTAIGAEETRAKAAEQANATAIDAVEGRLDTLEGNGKGSVSKAVADGIASVVASAPADFDTLKEVADWIANDTTGAAKMQADIGVLMGADTVEGSVAKAKKDAKDYADGLDSAMDARVDKLEAAVGEGGSVAAQISAAIADLDANVSQTAGDDGLALSITEVDGKVTAISGSIAANTYDAYGAASDAQAAAASDATTKANTAETNAKAYADTQDNALYAAIVALSDAEITSAINSGRPAQT